MANMGSVLHMVGKIDDAIAIYKRSLTLDPMQTNAHSGLGLLYLMRGKFDEGWFEYEWRLRTAEAHYQPPPGPLWEGEPLAGRRLLVQAEQGLGDTLHFCRYLPLLKARGSRIVFNVHPPVASLIAHSMPWLEVVAGGGVPQSSYDSHCALLSIPHRLGTDLSSIPGEVPYLKAREDVVARWAKRLGNSGELKVGVVTTGNPKQLHNKMRMVPVKAMRPLFGIPGVKFYSLQVGYLSGELTRYSRGAVENLAPELTDFMETAGAMENLDLVLSCCTSVVHLAGALGRPTWVMLPSVADWRWLTDREDTPWYPTARLFRQRVATTWTDVIERVKEELRAVVAGDRARLTPFLKRPQS